MKCITNRASENHITPLQDAMWHRGIMGMESCVFNCFDTFEATIVSNNEIRIASGIGAIQGRFFCVEPGTYDSITIANGTQGEKRIDLICAEYTVDTANDTQDCRWVVLQGEATTGNPIPPTPTIGDIDNGDLIRQEAFFEVHIEGITIFNVKPVYKLWTIPEKNGGTNANNRKDAVKNLIELPMNTAPSEDTPVEWAKLGNFICYYNNSSSVINKATPLGTLEQIVHQVGDWLSIHHIWKEHGAANGAMYWRTGNAAGWNSLPDVSGADAWSRVLSTDSSVITVKVAETDLNDYREFGWYYFSSDYIPANKPAGTNGWLQVITNSGKGVKQIWYRMGTLNSNDYQTFVRTFNGTNWGDWKQIEMEFDVLPIIKGGTGATTVPDILKMLCSDGTGNASPAYLIGFDSGYENSGYISLSNLKKAMSCIGIKKVWSNGSPTSDFAAQTVSVTLTSGSLVAIEHKIDKSTNKYEISVFRVGTQGSLQQITDASKATDIQTSRTVNVKTTGVIFGAGYGKSIGSTSAGGTTASNLIPTAIYLIEGVV